MIRSWATGKLSGLKDLTLLNSFGCDISHGVGASMVKKFAKGLEEEGVSVMQEASVEGLVTNGAGAVVGVSLTNGNHIRAKKGVIFASGGFSHNRAMLSEHIPHPVYMTGASHGSDGIFHSLAGEVCASMTAMDKIWGCQTFLEQSFDQWEDQVSESVCVGNPPPAYPPPPYCFHHPWPRFASSKSVETAW